MGVSTDGHDRGDPHGFHYERMESEDDRIHMMRVTQAIVLRQTLARWIDDTTISDLDFAFWLHKVTYDDARELCAYAIKIMDGKI